MIHKMKLVDFAFNKMKNKEKDIEIRLNDEKRRLINVGDEIIFENINSKEILHVKVLKLHNYKTFKDLFKNFDINRFGLNKSDDYTIMYNFYTKDDENNYGALGIEVEVI